MSSAPGKRPSSGILQGQARAAYANGDRVFQCQFDVLTQKTDSTLVSTSNSKTDPTSILNSICQEGWELLNGAFVFVEQGSTSRDKLLSSGQQIAVKGVTVGYYLFKHSST